jgi:hypothetical protein
VNAAVPIHRCALLGALALAFGSLAGSARGQVEMLDRKAGLSCRVKVGLGTHVRQGSMLPVILTFENKGDPRAVRMETGEVPQVAAAFSVPTGANIRRCLYLPVYDSDVQYMFTSVVFRGAAGGRALGSAQVYDQMHGKNFVDRTWSMDDPSSGRRSRVLIGLLIARSPDLTSNEDLFPPFKLKTDKVDAVGLPDHWLAYSGIDVIAVEQPVWARADLPRRPMFDWAAMGGILLVVDAPPAERRHTLDELAGQTPWVLDDPRSDRTVYRVGMGGLCFVDEAFIRGSHSRFLKDRKLYQGLDGRVRDYARPERPPIRGVGKPPFWPVLLCLVAFSIVVGPLGWWYLVKRQRRLLLYYAAAPAASVVAIALTVGGAMLNEGFRPYVSCVGVRFLDQRVHKSIDLSQFGAYVPFGFGTDIEGSADELPHFLPGENDMMVTRRLICAREGDRRRYGGVLPTRMKAWFGRQELRLDRRRLVVWEEQGRIHVENLLECELRDLLVSHNGKGARFDRLGPGEKTSAAPIQRSELIGHADQRLNDFRRAVSNTVPSKAHDLGYNRMRTMLLNGNAYVAEVRGQTAEHVWFDRFRVDTDTCFILGVCE